MTAPDTSTTGSADRKGKPMAIATKSLQNKITRAAKFEKVQEQYADAFIGQSAAIT